MVNSNRCRDEPSMMLRTFSTWNRERAEGLYIPFVISIHHTRLVRYLMKCVFSAQVMIQQAILSIALSVPVVSSFFNTREDSLSSFVGTGKFPQRRVVV